MIATSCDGGELPCGRAGCLDVASAELLEKSSNKWWCDYFSGSDGGLEAWQLRMYPFLREVSQRLVQKMSGTGPSFVLYSGHDSAIAPIAAALGFFRDGDACRWPRLAAHIVVELWLPASDQWPAGLLSRLSKVRILYNGVAVTSGVIGCRGRGELCPVRDFIAGVNGSLGGYVSYSSACQAPPPPEPASSESSPCTTLQLLTVVPTMVAAWLLACA
eukprot:gnl/TRDRNA2_/TRDRNA2_156783_c0_seq1.p1 gnl/TRDRNA2_/TRDRNA2_156783_c0~~gnl/TRDRNA2_/TRDRNA2_156783_c0_seq1.p1  ORF type:complete len:217 (+),score=25.73 gnl/TRDRNA2_/TRDRNA2_156783_c0_seq1:53-703(+)